MLSTHMHWTKFHQSIQKMWFDSRVNCEFFFQKLAIDYEMVWIKSFMTLITHEYLYGRYKFSTSIFPWIASELRTLNMLRNITLAGLPMIVHFMKSIVIRFPLWSALAKWFIVSSILSGIKLVFISLIFHFSTK